MPDKSIGLVPLSKMSQEYWNTIVSESASKTRKDSSSERRIEFQKQLEIRLEPYNYTLLITAVFYKVDGYGAGIHSNTETKEYKQASTLEYESYTFFAWVIGVTK